MSTARIKTFRKSKRAQGFEPSTSSLGIRLTTIANHYQI